MSNNTLPVIEIGDTVIFRTDLVNDELYGLIPFFDEMKVEINSNTKVRDVDLTTNTFLLVNGLYFYSFEMVKEVIKPTKERVYTEQEMVDFADKYAEYSYRASMHNRFKSPMSAKEYFQEYIESLNK